MSTQGSKGLAVLALLLTLAANSACVRAAMTRSAPTITPAGRLYPYTVRIARETAEDLREVATIEEAAGYGPVLALLMTPDAADILVVTSGDGAIRRYDGATGMLVSTFRLGIAAAGPGAFDRSGEALIAARVREETVAEASATRIGDIAIWSTRTGDLVRCVDMRCFEGDTYPADELGAALSADGSHWVVYREGSYSVRTASSSVAVILNSPDSDIDSWKRLGAAAIDSNGDRVAAAAVNGEVQIRGGSPYFGLEVPRQAEGIVSALSFSPDEDFLARVWSGKVSVWRLGLLRGWIVLDAEAPSAAYLSWSSDGRLLYVAGGNEIAVWDTCNWAKVTTLPAPSVEVVTPSPDGTLLLWGDSMGIVHVLAAD